MSGADKPNTLTKSISIHISPPMEGMIQKIICAGFYPDRSELIRAGIRKVCKELGIWKME